MSYYIQNDGDLGPQVASNSGWGDFGRWTDSLNPDDYGEVIGLYGNGWSDKPTDLASQLKDAQVISPPFDKETADVLSELISTIDAKTVVSITDGIGE